MTASPPTGQQQTAVKAQEKKEAPKPNARLAGSPPLTTILQLTFGPLMSQVSGALYGFINTIWASRVLGEETMTALSTATAFDNIGRAFGYFLCVAASSKISALFGQHLDEEASQVICDLLRTAIIFGIIVPAIMCPCEPIAVKWFGADQEVIDLGYKYIAPIFYCSVFTCFNLCVTGALQAEGRTTLIGVITLISLVICCGGLVPLFLYVFKWGMAGAGIATVLSDAVPGVSLIICFFCGKFRVKPKLNQLLNKFSPHTWAALKVGVSQFFANISVSIPAILLRKLIGLSVTTTDDFNNTLAGFNVIFRYVNLASSVLIALNMGFIPAASYANSAGNQRRYLALAGHLIWIGFAWSLITWIISYVWPRQVSSIFGNGEEYLYWAERMLKTGNLLGILLFSRFNFQAIFQAKQLGGRASLISILSQLLSIIVASLILYFTDKRNPVRITYAFPVSYAFGFVLGISLMIRPGLDMIRLFKAQKAKELQDLDAEEAGAASEREKVSTA